MRAPVASQRPVRRLCAAILRLPVVLALLVLAVLPPGVMAGQDAAGQNVMVICSGDGPVSLAFDPATGTYKPVAPDDGKSSPCDWRMMQGATDLPSPLVLPEPAFASRRASPALARLAFRPAHDPRGIWARGPPSFG